METPSKIRVIKPNRLGARWYNNRVGESFTVVGYNDADEQYQVDLRELYKNGEVDSEYALVPKSDAEIVC